MRNQPKYNFFKNTNYAVDGLKDIIKNEKSFKIELVCIVLLAIFSLFLELSLALHLLLISSLFVILIVEAINSAIERCVDLVTKEYNELAKKAKDTGSAAVFLSISLASLIWIFVLGSLIW